MRVSEIQTLAGPNICSHRPVLAMKIYLDELTDKESRDLRGFNERLLALLPGLSDHHCALGRPGGFIERLNEGTYFGHVIEHIALELTNLAGVPVTHGKTRQMGEPGCYRIFIEYQAEQGTKFLLRAAVEMIDYLLRGESYPLAEKLDEAQKLIARTELGPSTKAIVEAATRRNIPWRRIGQGSLVQFGYGHRRQFIQAAMTSQSSAIAVEIASDKDLTKTLLRQASLPVPEGAVAETEEDAVITMLELSAPVAVKPWDGNQGKGVSLNLTTTAQVEQAFRLARQYSSKVIVEEMLRGRDYRVLVVNGQMVAACERVPAHVIGDGIHTINQLIEIVNQDPARGDGHDKSLTRITLDPPVVESLRRRNLSLTHIPAAGEQIFLRECANLSTGGTARDVTELVHPQMRALCERAARVIGLDVCGIDLILKDISQPPQTGDGIVEVNAAPGLRMHSSPSEGQSRDVGDAIMETLYPAGDEGRIPIVAITGTNGKTTITRMIGQALATQKKVVGMTTTDGIFINGETILRGDTTGAQSALTVLSDPRVEVAVLETARGGIVRRGLGYDWSDVAVISNIRGDHLGQDGIESLDDLVYVKSLVAERVREGGTLVLNADDERLAQLMEVERVKRIPKKVVWFSLRPHHVLIRRHLATGGTAFIYRHGWIVEATQETQIPIVQAAQIPVTFAGAAEFQIANALAAAAACRALGMTREEIAAALSEFRSDEHNAGRANLYQVGSSYVMLDYGHNPDAFAAIGRMAANWSGRDILGVIGVPGDRNNETIEQAGRAAANSFQRIIIKEDRDRRGRRAGEVAELLRRAVKSVAPDSDCRVVLNENEAIRLALRELRSGEVAVIFYEKIEPALAILKEFGARPVDSIAAPAQNKQNTLQFPAAKTAPTQLLRQA
jgi:cyanophycin synthetase